MVLTSFTGDGSAEAPMQLCQKSNPVEYLNINLTHNLPGRMTRGCILRLIWKYIAYPVSTGSEISGKWFYLFVSLFPHLLWWEKLIPTWQRCYEKLKWPIQSVGHKMDFRKMNWFLSLREWAQRRNWPIEEKDLRVRNTWCFLMTNQPSLDDVIPHSPTLSLSLSVSLSLSHAHTHRVYSSFKQKEKNNTWPIILFRNPVYQYNMLIGNPPVLQGHLQSR